MELNNRAEQTIYHSKLISGYLLGELNDEQQAELLQWINESEHHRDLFERLCHEGNLENADALFALFDTEAALAAVKSAPDFRPVLRPYWWKRVAVAAAVVGVLVIAGLYLWQPVPKPAVATSAYGQDVAPGTKGATLTLANGQKIRLAEVANGDVAKDAGVTITKSANGQLVYKVAENNTENKKNTISTAMGETYQVQLPDGSAVWLNAASSLTYFAQLQANGERRVWLDGEGYFEVAKDMKHPFIVETGDQQVEVLGTHFNVNSYKDEQSVKTTLMEGAVKVHAGAGERVLKVGQQTLNNGGQLTVAAVDIDNVIDWKNNEFLLDNQDLQGALRKIARWYNLEIIYGKDVPLKAELGGGISRDSKLSAVLKLIESTGLVHFRIEGRKLYVDK